MAPGARAQTTIDFAIAMGVFLVALTTVVAFMPTMTQPYTGGQQNPLLADRLATQLTDGQLGAPSTPSKLDTDCTWHFFNRTDPEACESFDADADVQTKLGIDETIQVNVTLRNTSANSSMERLCGTPGATTVYEPPCDDGPDDILMAEGPNPPTVSGSVTIARRYAVLGDEPVFVVVKVWT